MKIKHLLMMLLVAGAWASCSDDGGLASSESQELAEGNAFISLNVVLPTINTPASRAGEGLPDNDNFDNGVKKEYDIKDLTVLLFNSPDDSGVLQKVYSTRNGTLVQPGFGTANTNGSNITTQANLGAMSVADKSNVYAVVIANINANTPNYSPGITTIADVKNTFNQVNASNFNTTGFYMVNSPIVDPNDLSKSFAIVECTPYETPQKATDNASTVNIERILAKVELLRSDADWSGWTYTVPSSSSKSAGDKITFLGWGLDITNTTSNHIRKIDDKWLNDNDWGLSYTGTNARTTNRFKGVATDPMRIYWAIDPNYSTGDAANRIFDKTICTNAMGENGYNIDYCLENTFDAANQKQGQTTRVMLKTKYTRNGTTGGNMYRTQTYNYMTEKQLNTRMIDELNKILSNVSSITDFKFYTKDYVKGSYIDKSLKKAKLAEVTVTFTTSSTQPYTYKLGDRNSENPEELVGIVEKLNAAIGRLDYFKDGETYYYARIKHFGDDITPWANNDDYINNELSTKYLGRYGIVRNNWYKLTVNSIKNGPGEPIVPGIPGVDPVNPDEPKPGDPVDPNNPDGPVVPEDPTDPTIPGIIPDAQDDEMNYYIDCTINVLSWAVRSQQLDW